MTHPVLSLQADWAAAELSALPLTVSPWLLEPSSLTARLKRHCQQFRLQLLQEGPSKLPDFLQPLLPGIRQAQLREVILWCDEQPCVYAQSWLPQATISALSPLADLGQRPLGDYIFQQGDLIRGPIEAALLSVTLPVLPQLSTQLCWARRSVFQLNNHPLLVAEVFLPAVQQLTVQSQ